MGGIIRHEDLQGILSNPLVGVTAWTTKQYRTTGLVYPHIVENDVFSMTFQMSHKKKLASNLDSVHLHYIPIASANGDIKIDFAWGWYKHGDTIPATLPNTGSTTITLATTDQYKLKASNIITNLTFPAGEDYSSILFVKLTRSTPAGTNWGALNEIALVYMDTHYLTDRDGSVAEYTD